MASILVVDDEKPVRDLLHIALTQDNHNVLLAKNGREAVELQQNHQFDLVITDMVMPEKNGIDLIMELKKKNPASKVLAISGGGGIDGRFDYLSIAKLIGAEHIISKPFDLKTIREKVNATLGV